ncbi:MAG: nuclear transport factor 2 family protein [Dehalococcoidia bacterium]
MSDLKETVERMLAVYNRHDAAGFAACFARDGVLRVVATGEVNEGREQIQAGREVVWRALDYTLEPRGLYECGEHVWLEWTMTGTNVGEWMGIPPTHRRVEGLLGCSHFTFGADGLIAQDDVYFDSATLLRQLGLLPEPEAAQPA